MAAIPVPATTPPATKPWPADVVAFATQRGVADYLDPMLEATRRMFPTARLIELRLERDPEIPAADGILFLIHITAADIPDIVGAYTAWHTETFRCCPAPLLFNFILQLRRENA